MSTNRPDAPSVSGRGDRLLILVVACVPVLVWWALTTETREQAGIAMVLLLPVLLLLGIPVGAAMGLSGVLGIFALQGFSGILANLRTLPYNTTASWSLSVLPMFILMGLLLWRSGSTERLYRSTQIWLGWLPGGLAVTTNTAGAALGAASGSTLGIAYALGRIGLPEMLSAGYPKRISLASVLMAGSGGQLIPPSILLVVYAGVAGTPIGDQLLAGLLPGLLLVSGYGLVLVGASWWQRDEFGTPPAAQKLSLGVLLRSIPDLLPVPLVIVVVIGGIYSGAFTATEAGAIGAFMGLILAVWYRRDEIREVLTSTLSETVATTGAIFFLLIGGAVLSRALAMSGLTRAFAGYLGDLEVTRIQFLLLLLVFYIVLGTFLDPLAVILLTVPIIGPLLPALDIGLIWFGVFVVLMAELAIVTPPVGILLFVVHRIAQDRDVAVGQEVALSDVVRATFYFLPVAVVLAVVMILLPQVTDLLL